MLKYLEFHPKKHVKIFEGKDKQNLEGEVIIVAAMSHEEAEAFLMNKKEKSDE